MSHDDVLLLFGKVPRPGDVKTRLMPILDATEASELYCAFLRDIASRTRPAGVVTQLWLAPSLGLDSEVARTECDLRRLPLSCERQSGSDLAERMIDAFQRVFESGARHVVLRNTDSPLLPIERELEAFAALHRGVDVVLGPDLGGGYYLVGMRRPCPALFSDLPMSVPSNFDRTLLRARSLGLAVEELKAEPDVDHAADLAELIATLLADSSAREFAPHTTRVALRFADRLRRSRTAP